MTISSLLKTAALVGALAPLAQAQAPVPSTAPVPPPTQKPAPAPLPAPRPIVSDRETIQAQVDALNNIANELMAVGLSEDETREIVNKIAPKVFGQRPVRAVPATKIQPASMPDSKPKARIRGKMQTKVFVNGKEVSSCERTVDETVPAVTPSVKINGCPVALPSEGGKIIVTPDGGVRVEKPAPAPAPAPAPTEKIIITSHGGPVIGGAEGNTRIFINGQPVPANAEISIGPDGKMINLKPLPVPPAPKPPCCGSKPDAKPAPAPVPPAPKPDAKPDAKPVPPAPKPDAKPDAKPAPAAPADKAMQDAQKPRLLINGREVTLPANGGTIIIDEDGRVTTPAQP